MLAYLPGKHAGHAVAPEFGLAVPIRQRAQNSSSVEMPSGRTGGTVVQGCQASISCENLPGGHMRQVVWLEDSAYAPGEQRAQRGVAALGACVLRGQRSQRAMPSRGACVPGEHAAHAVEAVKLVNAPGGQAAQRDCPWRGAMKP